MKTTTKTAVAAITLALASFASQAQAHTVLRYLPKSAVPYSVPHQEPRTATAAQAHKLSHAKPAASYVYLASKPLVSR